MLWKVWKKLKAQPMSRAATTSTAQPAACSPDMWVWRRKDDKTSVRGGFHREASRAGGESAFQIPKWKRLLGQ